MLTFSYHSCSDPQDSIYVVGQGTTTNKDKLDILRWNPRSNEELVIGNFPKMEGGKLATLEGQLFYFSWSAIQTNLIYLW